MSNQLIRGCYIHTIQPTQETNIHALSWIQTYDSSNQVATHVCLRLHSHQDQEPRLSVQTNVGSGNIC